MLEISINQSIGEQIQNTQAKVSSNWKIWSNTGSHPRWTWNTLKAPRLKTGAIMQSLNSTITKETLNHKHPRLSSEKKEQQKHDQFLKLHTCCIATCGCVLRCCWGLRTPAAYLYCGTVRTAGVAAVAAAAGRGPIVCVDVLAEKTTILLMNSSIFNSLYKS